MARLTHALLFLAALAALILPLAAHRASASAAPSVSADLPVHMFVRTIWPRKVDQAVDCFVYLWTDAGPVRPEDLREARGSRLHLYMLTPDFQDFYHAYPVPTGGEGEYRFTITPLRREPLRVWADFTGRHGHKVVHADLNGEMEPHIPPQPPQSIQAETEEVVFTIHFSEEVRAGRTAPGTIYATHKSTRLPYRELEPVLDSYAHLVAISSDYATLFNIEATRKVADRGVFGGPAVKFYITPTRPGMMRIYARFRTRGYDLIAPFTLRVAPAKPNIRRRGDDGDPDDRTPPRPPDAAPPGE